MVIGKLLDKLSGMKCPHCGSYVSVRAMRRTNKYSTGLFLRFFPYHLCEKCQSKIKIEENFKSISEKVSFTVFISIFIVFIFSIIIVKIFPLLGIPSFLGVYNEVRGLYVLNFWDLIVLSLLSFIVHRILLNRSLTVVLESSATKLDRG